MTGVVKGVVRGVVRRRSGTFMRVALGSKPLPEMVSLTPPAAEPFAGTPAPMGPLSAVTPRTPRTEREPSCEA